MAKEGLSLAQQLVRGKCRNQGAAGAGGCRGEERRLLTRDGNTAERTFFSSRFSEVAWSRQGDPDGLGWNLNPDWCIRGCHAALVPMGGWRAARSKLRTCLCECVCGWVCTRGGTGQLCAQQPCAFS